MIHPPKAPEPTQTSLKDFFPPRPICERAQKMREEAKAREAALKANPKPEARQMSLKEWDGYRQICEQKELLSKLLKMPKKKRMKELNRLKQLRAFVTVPLPVEDGMMEGFVGSAKQRPDDGTPGVDEIYWQCPLEACNRLFRRHATTYVKNVNRSKQKYEHNKSYCVKIKSEAEYEKDTYLKEREAWVRKQTGGGTEGQRRKRVLRALQAYLETREDIEVGDEIGWECPMSTECKKIGRKGWQTFKKVRSQ